MRAYCSQVQERTFYLFLLATIQEYLYHLGSRTSAFTYNYGVMSMYFTTLALWLKGSLVERMTEFPTLY